MNPYILVSTFALSFLLSGGAFSSTTEEENPPKQVTHYPGESNRVEQQKDAGILEGDRNYDEKSDFVKNRDRAEGAAQKIGEDIKDTVNKLF